MSLSVDHDHVTGRIRGLLCRQHNSLLGYMDDDVDQLRKSIEYLKQSSIDVKKIIGKRGRGQRESDLRKYGITQMCYNAILASQDGHCAICDRTVSDDGRLLDVDHCHNTGKIRGLLCSHHNIALGLVNDDVDELELAIKYLVVTNG